MINMASLWYHKYYRGFFLPYICRAWGLDKAAAAELHDAFKRAFDIESTQYLDDVDFKSFIESIQGLLIVEYGLLVPYINEPDNVDELDMTTFLSLYR